MGLAATSPARMPHKNSQGQQLSRCENITPFPKSIERDTKAQSADWWQRFVRNTMRQTSEDRLEFLPPESNNDGPSHLLDRYSQKQFFRTEYYGALDEEQVF